MKDYYYILGVKRNASPKEIKAAYRKLSLKFHPDKNQGDSFFEDRFKDINEAYETLNNKNRRLIYDHEWKVKNGNDNDFEEEFSDNDDNGGDGDYQESANEEIRYNYSHEKSPFGCNPSFVNSDPDAEYIEEDDSVFVNQSDEPMKILDFTVSKDTITEGEELEIQWEVYKATSIKINAIKGSLSEHGHKKIRLKKIAKKEFFDLVIYADNENTGKKRKRTKRIVIEPVSKFEKEGYANEEAKQQETVEEVEFDKNETPNNAKWDETKDVRFNLTVWLYDRLKGVFLDYTSDVFLLDIYKDAYSQYCVKKVFGDDTSNLVYANKEFFARVENDSPKLLTTLLEKLEKDKKSKISRELELNYIERFDLLSRDKINKTIKQAHHLGLYPTSHVNKKTYKKAYKSIFKEPVYTTLKVMHWIIGIMVVLAIVNLALSVNNSSISDSASTYIRKNQTENLKLYGPLWLLFFLARFIREEMLKKRFKVLKSRKLSVALIIITIASSILASVTILGLLDTVIRYKKLASGDILAFMGLFIIPIVLVAIGLFWSRREARQMALRKSKNENENLSEIEDDNIPKNESKFQSSNKEQKVSTVFKKELGKRVGLLSLLIILFIGVYGVYKFYKATDSSTKEKVIDHYLDGEPVYKRTENVTESNKKSIRSLYDTYKNRKGVELGSYEQFRNKLKDKDFRKMFFNYFSKNGGQDLGKNLKEFEKIYGLD